MFFQEMAYVLCGPAKFWKLQDKNISKAWLDFKLTYSWLPWLSINLLYETAFQLQIKLLGYNYHNIEYVFGRAKSMYFPGFTLISIAIP